VIEVAVFGTIAGSVAAWAAAEWLHSRALWTVGAALAVSHSAAAFAAFHDWSHERAMIATAQQTAALTGLDWGGGLFFNYAFLLVWVADVSWWWIARRSYDERPRAIDVGIRGFLFFMFVNGAIVFADGVMRVIGIVAVAIVSVSWLMRSFAQIVPAR
jgi:hypothetical protein